MLSYRISRIARAYLKGSSSNLRALPRIRNDELSINPAKLPIRTGESNYQIQQPLQFIANPSPFMAPIRRYLRITKYSVLECRIYLHNPADTRWLLNSQDKVLSRIFERIRPHVLPKLREENERAKAKKKSNPVKDVISEG